jgi:hypothetical protein
LRGSAETPKWRFNQSRLRSVLFAESSVTAFSWRTVRAGETTATSDATASTKARYWLTIGEGALSAMAKAAKRAAVQDGYSSAAQAGSLTEVTVPVESETTNH